VLRKLPEVQREFIRTQHLHAVASSIAKPPVDAFVSVVTADARSMVNLVCVYETAPDSVVARCLLAQVVWMREEYNSVCQLLLRPIISAVLADTDISVKPKYRPIYQPGRYIGRSLGRTKCLLTKQKVL